MAHTARSSTLLAAEYLLQSNVVSPVAFIAGCLGCTTCQTLEFVVGKDELLLDTLMSKQFEYMQMAMHLVDEDAVTATAIATSIAERSRFRRARP